MVLAVSGPLTPRDAAGDPEWNARLGGRRYRLRCVPSQRGALLVFLHPQNG